MQNLNVDRNKAWPVCVCVCKGKGEGRYDREKGIPSSEVPDLDSNQSWFQLCAQQN